MLLPFQLRWLYRSKYNPITVLLSLDPKGLKARGFACRLVVEGFNGSMKGSSQSILSEISKSVHSTLVYTVKPNQYVHKYQVPRN